MAKEKKEDFLDDLISKEFAGMKDLSKEDDTVKYWIDSGNYALNYVCSKNFSGAYPLHHITAFVGKSGVGKSMLPVIASKDTIFDRVFIFDSEGGGSGVSLAKFVGAPIEKMKLLPIKTLDCYKIRKEDGKIDGINDNEMPSKKETDTFEFHQGLNLTLKKLIYALEYNHTEQETLIIIDSLSNITSSRALSGTADMGKTNQLLNQLFSILDSTLENAKVTIMFAGKVYTDINNTYNVEGITKGGESVVYNPSLMLSLTALQDNPEMSDADLKEEKESRKTGLGANFKNIRARIKKSRFGTESRNAFPILDATYGLTRLSGLFQLLVDFKVCIKNGSRYTIPDVIVNEKGEPISFYKKEFPEVFAKKEKEYIEKLQKIMDEREEDIKKKRQQFDANDTDEINTDDEEFSTTDMLNAMEVEKEMDSE